MADECYGRMFPDMLQLTANRRSAGKVFSAEVKSFGIGVQGRDVSVDWEQWAKCKACPEYRTCYDMSLGRFVLESNLVSYG
jgi:hypothetical protein